MILGWFFEENRFHAKLARSALSTVVSNIDKTRVSAFTASGKKHKALCINGLTRDICTKTDAHGLVKTQFQVTNNDIERFRVSGGTQGKVEYTMSTIDGNIRSKGEIFLCDDDGVSIISDIVSKI